MNLIDEMVKAAAEGDISKIQALLKQDAPVNRINSRKVKLLSNAMQGLSHSIFKRLSNKNTDDETNSEASITTFEDMQSQRLPLNEAAYRGHEEIVKLLLERKALVNTQAYGRTPLHEAADGGHLSIVTRLVNAGATTHAKDLEGRTPIHIAAGKGYQLIVSWLLHKGAFVDDKDKEQNTLLHAASSWGQLSTAECLINAGATVSITNKDGYTPLHLAARRGYTEIVNLLLKKGALVNDKTVEGNAPLHEAALGGHILTAQLLVQANALINTENSNGETPLYNALHINQLGSRHIPVIQYLLKKGAYSHPHRASKNILSGYFQESALANRVNNYFHTTLLLAGVNSQGVELPEALQIVKSNIEATIMNWLEPLHCSEKAYRNATPSILRAMPRIIDWLNIIAQTLIDETNSLPKNYAESFFMMIKQRQDNQSLFWGLQNRGVPQELEDLIKERFIQKELIEPMVEFLTKSYMLPQKIAKYLTTDSLTHPKEYQAFYIRCWEHTWQTPCSPPTGKVPTPEVATSLQKLQL